SKCFACTHDTPPCNANHPCKPSAKQTAPSVQDKWQDVSPPPNPRPIMLYCLQIGTPPGARVGALGGVTGDVWSFSRKLQCDNALPAKRCRITDDWPDASTGADRKTIDSGQVVTCLVTVTPYLGRLPGGLSSPC